MKLASNKEVKEISYQLDLPEQTLIIGSKRIKLRKKLWQVFLHLETNKNQLVVKNELVNNYWDNDFNRGNIAVTNSISHLRKILEKHLKHCSIITIAKRGYIFSDKIHHSK